MIEKKKGKLDQVLSRLDEHDKNFEEIKGNFEEIKGNFEEIRNKFNDVLTGQDKIAGELEKAREDRVFAKAKDDELEKRLEKVVPM